MNKAKSTLLIALCLAALTAGAQTRRTSPTAAKTAVVKAKDPKAKDAKPKPKAKPKPLRPANPALYATLLPATAKVMFIDSAVVARAELTRVLPTSVDMGRMTMRGGTDDAPLMQYDNQLGDRRIYADGDTTGSALYSQTRLASGWGKAHCLDELAEERYAAQNFPFMLADGVTLFFSATGPQSVGGRDIFTATLDADKGKYRNPQNYGLPFNSAANDYLLAISETDSLGWLVTDRYQTADSVCIYTFVPTAARRDFQQDDLTTAQLKRYAELRSIRDTWRFGNRQAALRRRDAMMRRVAAARQSATAGPAIVVTDRRTAQRRTDLRTPAARRLYDQLAELTRLEQATAERLDALRTAYAARRDDVTARQIVRDERNLLRLRADIKDLGKRIRQAEN